MNVSLKMIWRTQKDRQVCPICRQLDGYTWNVNIGESYPKQLIHPLFGPVYDNRPAADCSLVNQENGHICRCSIEHQLDVSPKPENDNVLYGESRQKVKVEY